MKWVEPVKSIILTCLGRVLPFWGRGQGEDAKTILTTLWMAFLRNKKRFQHLLIIFIQPVLCKVPKSHTWVKVNVLEWLRQRKVRKEEKVGDGEKEREKECREEREKASQTDCLAAPGSPALSVIWFWGQRLSSLMNIGPSLVSLTKERELFSLPESGKFISGIRPANTRL